MSTHIVFSIRIRALHQVLFLLRRWRDLHGWFYRKRLTLFSILLKLTVVIFIGNLYCSCKLLIKMSIPVKAILLVLFALLELLLIITCRVERSNGLSCTELAGVGERGLEARRTGKADTLWSGATDLTDCSRPGTCDQDRDRHLVLSLINVLWWTLSWQECIRLDLACLWWR